MPIGKGRMRPANTAPLIQLIRRRFDQFGSANLLISIRREPSNYQFAALVEHEVLRIMPDHVDSAPTSLWHCRLALPNALSTGCIKAAQLAEAVDTIDVIPVKYRCADD